MSETNELPMPAPHVGYLNGEQGPILVITTGKDSVCLTPDALAGLINQLEAFENVLDNLGADTSNEQVGQALKEAGL